MVSRHSFHLCVCDHWLTELSRFQSLLVWCRRRRGCRRCREGYGRRWIKWLSNTVCRRSYLVPDFHFYLLSMSPLCFPPPTRSPTPPLPLCFSNLCLPVNIPLTLKSSSIHLWRPSEDTRQCCPRPTPCRMHRPRHHRTIVALIEATKFYPPSLSLRLRTPQRPR